MPADDTASANNLPFPSCRRQASRSFLVTYYAWNLFTGEQVIVASQIGLPAKRGTLLHCSFIYNVIRSHVVNFVFICEGNSQWAHSLLNSCDSRYTSICTYKAIMPSLTWRRGTVISSKCTEHYWLVEAEWEGEREASILDSPDLKHASKLTICVIYAFSNRWIGIRFLSAAANVILRYAGCRCVPGQWVNIGIQG